MPSHYLARKFRSWSKVTALAFALTTPLSNPAVSQAPAAAINASPVQSVFADLSEQEKTTLGEGQVIITAERSGNQGQFIARILIDASIDDTWQVLTDYDNFEQFLPNIENSQLLESAENRRVFEQMNVISVVPTVIDIRSRVVIESIESFPERVDFSLVEGDLDALEGVWKLEPVAFSKGAATEKVLITHQVDIDPGDGLPRGLFFSTYQLVLEDSLAAAKQEAERRAAL